MVCFDEVSFSVGHLLAGWVLGWYGLMRCVFLCWAFVSWMVCLDEVCLLLLDIC